MCTFLWGGGGGGVGNLGGGGEMRGIPALLNETLYMCKELLSSRYELTHFMNKSPKYQRIVSTKKINKKTRKLSLEKRLLSDSPTLGWFDSPFL